VQETTPDLRPRVLRTEAAARYCGGMSVRSFQTFRDTWNVPAIKLLPQIIAFDVADLDRAIADARAASIAEEQVKAAARIAAAPSN